MLLSSDSSCVVIISSLWNCVVRMRGLQEEQKILDKHMGRPEKPPSSAYSLFRYRPTVLAQE